MCPNCRAGGHGLFTARQNKAINSILSRKTKVILLTPNKKVQVNTWQFLIGGGETHSELLLGETLKYHTIPKMIQKLALGFDAAWGRSLNHFRYTYWN